MSVSSYKHGRLYRHGHMSIPKTTDEVLVGVPQHLADQFITWRSPLSLGNLANLDPSSALINQLGALCAFANGTAKSSRREKEKTISAANMHNLII